MAEPVNRAPAAARSLRWPVVLTVPHRPLRVALRYWRPRRLTLRTNYDGSPRKRVHAWLWWNF